MKLLTKSKNSKINRIDYQYHKKPNIKNIWNLKDSDKKIETIFYNSLLVYIFKRSLGSKFE